MENSLWLGLDTGGTFTDAVLLADGRRVLASAKSLTTHWDLSIGIGHAIRAVLDGIPGGAGRENIELVSVSTTLATNAVVESRFSPVCTLLIGFDEAMTARSGLLRQEGVVVRIRGKGGQNREARREHACTDQAHVVDHGAFHRRASGQRRSVALG